MRFTVLGARGFIGSRLARHLTALGDVDCPKRGEALAGRPLGHVLYCIGLTADFRWRPFDTVDAHVGELSRTLSAATFESFTYLSSTRVYAAAEAAVETGDIPVDPADPGDLYDISKLLGESLVLTCGGPQARVVRLSNVYGPAGSESFLSVLLEQARQGCIRLESGLDSEKDYIHVDQVVELLPGIATRGRDRIYNVATGRNTSHRAIVDVLVRQTGCRVEVTPGAPTLRFPTIDVTRIRRQFGFRPTDLLEALPALIRNTRTGPTAERIST